MGKDSAIEWTHHTFNPWHGCTKISDGCTNCYADTHDRRWGESHWGPRARRRFFGERHWGFPGAWDRSAERADERHRVFCGSMCDVFELLPEEHPDREQQELERRDLARLIERTPSLDWLLLTKRPENHEALSQHWWDRPPPNIWLGATMEHQAAHDSRLEGLLAPDWPARRFISYEPALGPVKFELSHIDWLIVGGESGHGRRLMNPHWVRLARDQCARAGVPFFYKQRQGPRERKKISLPVLDGRQWAEVPRG